MFQNSHKQHSNPEEQGRREESEITGLKTLWTQIHRFSTTFLLCRQRQPYQLLILTAGLFLQDYGQAFWRLCFFFFKKPWAFPTPGRLVECSVSETTASCTLQSGHLCHFTSVRSPNSPGSLQREVVRPRGFCHFCLLFLSPLFLSVFTVRHPARQMRAQ